MATSVYIMITIRSGFLLTRTRMTLNDFERPIYLKSALSGRHAWRTYVVASDLTMRDRTALFPVRSKLFHGGGCCHFEKLQMAITQQRVIRSTSCLVLEWGFRFDQIQECIWKFQMAIFLQRIIPFTLCMYTDQWPYTLPSDAVKTWRIWD